VSEWFKPKRYGYGAGLPISWQGWVLMIGFLAIVTVAAVVLDKRPLLLFPLLLPATAAFLIIVARKTRGGWRWRWDEKD
jgi:hypothetical protein